MRSADEDDRPSRQPGELSAASPTSSSRAARQRVYDLIRRAVDALVPYYQRITPLRIQALMPRAARRAVGRWLDGWHHEVKTTGSPLQGLPGSPPLRVRAQFRAQRHCDVSVVVPNHNYAHYLPERLRSILQQTMTPREIILLDDASTDQSIEVARGILAQAPIPFTIIRHLTRVGTYKQWLRGIQEAKGELVWIAEADDSCEPEMLASLVDAMEDDRVVIAYCQSKRVDQHGTVTAPDNLRHTRDLDPARWQRDYRELGTREVLDFLVYRNSIPNSSACLLRKRAISGIERELSRARFCGDRLLYVHMLRFGDIAYIAEPLNHFRRHIGAVTASRRRHPELLEEVARVRKYVSEHFPVHLFQISRMNHFLDRDYQVDGVTKNSHHPSVQPLAIEVITRARSTRRIAFITTNNGSYDGGSELWWREAAKKLRRLGHDVTILIKKWQPRPPFLDAFDRLGIKSYLKEEGGFDQVLRFRPDLVIVSVGDQDEGVEYYGRLQDQDLPYVIVNRLTKEPRFWPIRRGRNDKVRAGYLGAEKAFFTCRNNHRVMEERLECPLPDWGRIFSPCHADRNAKLPFPPVTPGVQLAVPAKILFIHKGQDLIVEVMKREHWRSRDVTINLYGVGRDEQRLRWLVSRSRLEDRIVFHGKLVFLGREQEISRIWLVNQAILMPSRMEGFPNMVAHAMLSGRVPIVTKIGGHCEVIEDGVTGFVAADPDPDALDDALERAYQRRHEWEGIGQRARDAMSAYLPDEPVTDAVEKLLAVISRQSETT